MVKVRTPDSLALVRNASGPVFESRSDLSLFFSFCRIFDNNKKTKQKKKKIYALVKSKKLSTQQLNTHIRNRDQHDITN